MTSTTFSIVVNSASTVLPSKAVRRLIKLSLVVLAILIHAIGYVQELL